MTITHLKTGKPDADRASDDAAVRGVVEATLADIAARGDAAVRDLRRNLAASGASNVQVECAPLERFLAGAAARAFAADSIVVGAAVQVVFADRGEWTFPAFRTV